MPDPFITTAELGNYLNRDLSADAAATIAVEGASDIVRTLTEQFLDLATSEVVVLDGTGTDALLLPERPVTSVSTVVEDDETLVADDDYKLRGDGVLIRMPTIVDEGWSTQAIRGSWSVGRQNISVTYSHGYAPTALPNDIRVVALTIAARLLQRNTGVTYESLGQYSVRYDGASTDLTSGERAILRKYKMAK